MKHRRYGYGQEAVEKRVGRWLKNTFNLFRVSLAIGLPTGLGYLGFAVPVEKVKVLFKGISHFIVYKLVGKEKSLQIVEASKADLRPYIGELYQAGFIAAAAAFISAVVMVFIFRMIGRKQSKEAHIRGSRLQAVRQLNRKMKEESKQFGHLNGYIIGKEKVKIPELYLWRSFAIAGRPGTGKSNLINQMLCQDRSRGVKAFIIDINGDYWRRFGRKGTDRVLSLRHKESELWDFWCEGVVMDLMAQYLIPKSKGAEFFWKGPRRVITALLERSSSLEEFRQDIVKSGEEIIAMLREEESEVASVLGRPGEGQFHGIMGSSVLDFSFLKDLGFWPKKMGKMEPFSIINWASSRDDSWVFVVVNDDELESLKPLIGLWFNLAIQGSLKRDPKGCDEGRYRSIRIVLDELKSLGRLEELEKGSERLRKHRVSLIAGYQNNAQLDDIYGHNGAKNLRETLQNKVIYSMGDPESQEDLSRLLGEREVEEVSDSEAYSGRVLGQTSLSRRISRRRVVLPSEIGALKDGECYLKICHFDPVKISIPYVHQPPINEQLDYGLPPRKKALKLRDVPRGQAAGSSSEEVEASAHSAGDRKEAKGSFEVGEGGLLDAAREAARRKLESIDSQL